MNWNPYIPIVLLLLITGGFHSIQNTLQDYKRDQQSALLEIRKEVSALHEQTLESTSALPATNSTGLNWPFSQCGLEPGEIDRLLGNGAIRERIETAAFQIHRSLLRKADDLKTQEAGRGYCEALQIGAPKLLAKMERQARKPKCASAKQHPLYAKAGKKW